MHGERHDLTFIKGLNHRTGQTQWQCEKKVGNVVTRYVVDTDSALIPSEAEHRFLCFERRELHKNENGRFRIVTVTLVEILPEPRSDPAPIVSIDDRKRRMRGNASGFGNSGSAA